MNLIKAHGGKGSWPFSFERLATSPPQADHVLVDLFSSVADGGALWAEPPQYSTFHPKEVKYTFFSNAHGTFSNIDHMIGHKKASMFSRELKTCQAFS